MSSLPPFRLWNVNSPDYTSLRLANYVILFDEILPIRGKETDDKCTIRLSFFYLRCIIGRRNSSSVREKDRKHWQPFYLVLIALPSKYQMRYGEAVAYTILYNSIHLYHGNVFYINIYYYYTSSGQCIATVCQWIISAKCQ